MTAGSQYTNAGIEPIGSPRGNAAAFPSSRHPGAVGMIDTAGSTSIRAGIRAIESQRLRNFPRGGLVISLQAGIGRKPVNRAT
jgi:hypothetical protein